MDKLIWTVKDKHSYGRLEQNPLKPNVLFRTVLYRIDLLLSFIFVELSRKFQMEYV